MARHTTSITDEYRSGKGKEKKIAFVPNSSFGKSTFSFFVKTTLHETVPLCYQSWKFS
jgi:hypothetical protein